MLVLALDTATAGVVVGLVRVATGRGAGLQVLAERHEPGPARHGERVSPAILAVLQEAGHRVTNLDAVVVGVGPGPFTGLRVGMVSAAALADALAIPAYGVCSLDAIAAGLPAFAGTTLVVTDARRREVYWAAYDAAGSRFAGPSVQAPAELASRLPELAARADLRAVGAGSVLYAELLGGRDPVDAAPSAAGLVRAAGSMLTGSAPPDPLVPLYLRRPDAVPPTTRKRALPA